MASCSVRNSVFPGINLGLHEIFAIFKLVFLPLISKQKTRFYASAEHVKTNRYFVHYSPGKGIQMVIDLRDTGASVLYEFPLGHQGGSQLYFACICSRFNKDHRQGTFVNNGYFLL